MFGLELAIGYVFGKIVDRLLPSRRMREKAKRLLQKQTLSDRFITLKSPALENFYSADSIMTIDCVDGRVDLPLVPVLLPLGNGRLDSQGLRCTIEEGRFKLDKSIADYTAPIIRLVRRDHQHFWNGSVIRLAGVTGLGELRLQPANYMEGLATNFAMDHKPKGRTESLREHLQGSARSVGPLEGSLLANHIGMVCMIETADGQLVAQVRSNKVANRPNGLSASMSGAARYLTLPRKLGVLGFADVVRSLVVQEVHMELGIEPQELRFLGLFRELERGGKPELYVYARCQEPFSELQSRQRHAESASEMKGLRGFEFLSDRVDASDQSRHSFQKRVEAILTECQDCGNLTFRAGCLLTASHVLRTTKT